MTGTGTEVGKTFVAARLLEQLRSWGWRVAARKPVQSYEEGAGPTDADVLANATGERSDDVCAPHWSYPRPLAPPMAAELLRWPPPTLDELATELAWPPGTQLGIVEGVGGPRSPLAVDGDTVELAAAIDPDVVLLVADAGLGAINAVRLAVVALARWPVTVVLNRFDGSDDLHRRNRAWLAEVDGFDVTGGVDEVAARLRARGPARSG